MPCEGLKLTNPRWACVRDFNVHVGNEAGVWKGLRGQRGDADFNDNGRFLLQLCCTIALCIMDTFFQHIDLHKYAWCRDSLGQQPLIDSCVVSGDLFQSLLNARFK